MKKYRLYIADVDMRFVSAIRSAVSKRSDMEIVGNSANGWVALSEISRLSPDVVLTDIPLPELDGIALLRQVKRLRRPAAVIVCTHFYSRVSMNCACKYGADFFLCKPVDLEALPSLIIECSEGVKREASLENTDNSEDETSRRAAIALEIMKRLGLSPRLDGSAYLLEAVLHCRDEMLLKNLSRGLYAEVARRMNTTPARVERSLRSAIQTAYERGALDEFFKNKPTNRELIVYLMGAVDAAEREKR